TRGLVASSDNVFELSGSHFDERRDQMNRKLLRKFLRCAGLTTPVALISLASGVLTLYDHVPCPSAAPPTFVVEYPGLHLDGALGGARVANASQVNARVATATT